MRKVEAFIPIVVFLLICPTSLLAQQTSRLVRADSISNYTFNTYRIVGKEGVFQFSEPQVISVYSGESFYVDDSCFIWRDSILLNSFCDTLFYGSGKDSTKVRATSIGGVLKLTTGSKIEYKSGWKPKLLSLFNDSIINVDSLSTLSVNGTNSVNNIKVSLFADSIVISMPMGDYDSCLVINETVGNKLCAVTHAGDTVKLSLGDLGIVHSDSNYIFRIHATGLPPCYFNYPADLLWNAPDAPTWLDFVINMLLPFWWIGLIIILIVSIIIVSAFFYRKKKISLAEMSVQKENGEERAVDSMERIKQHLNTIYEEYVMISKLVTEETIESELPDSELCKKEATQTTKMFEQMEDAKNRGKNADAALIMNSDISSLVSILGDNIDKLSEIINDKYQSLSSLRTQLEMKEADLEKTKEERDEYNKKFQEATSLISTMKEERLAVAQEHEKTVNQLKGELDQEKASTKQKVKDAEDKVKVELTKVQGELDQEKASTKQKVKEAEDKVKVELNRVQGELDQEKASTKQKVKEAEDKVKVELNRVQGELEQEKASTKQKVKEAEDKVKVELNRVQGELEQEKASTKRKVKEAEDKVKVELNRVQHALSIEKENTIRKIDIARAEEREEKRKAVQIKEAEISQLKLDQKFYLDNFVRMEFAQKYAGLLKQLLEVANDVEKAANGLMEGDKMDDAYYLYRAQAKYNLNLSKLNKSNFLAEIEMIARGQLVFNDSAITKYDKKDPEGSIKKYFYSYYLEKYFNALVIFNETLSGLHLFDTKLSEKDVSMFNNLSQRIYDIASKLGIEIATVHIGEQNKYSDVQILDRVDVGLPSNSIVSIENCKVSIKGGSKSPVKIKVILQK